MSSIEVATPIGAMRVDVRDERIVAVYLPNRAPDDRLAGGTARDERVLAAAAKQLTEYFAGKRRAFDLPLEAGGTPFQQRVWRALLAVPFGETCSYGDIARAIDAPVSASRAVGAANGANPIAIVVPCHRVIGASGKLVGYGGGLPAKQWLLAHEREIAPKGLDAYQLTL
jgi:methylated-DNA-[protein]-cysteine S-methyltransferase